MQRTRSAGPFVIMAVLILTAASSHAQMTTCKTVNCEVGTTAGLPNLPMECQNIATPRIIEVAMNDIFVFVPSNPRIEGESTTPGVPWSYQCIQWHTVGIEPHSSTEDVGCDIPNFDCLAPQTMPSLWRDVSPGMPAPANLAPGGTALRSLTDPAAPGAAFYLVVERN